MINVRRLEEPLTIEVAPPDRDFPAWRVFRSDSNLIRIFPTEQAAIDYAKAQGVPFQILDRTDDDTRWKPFYPRQ